MAADTGPLSTAESALEAKIYGGLIIVLVTGFFGIIAASFRWAPKLPGDTFGLVMGSLMTWIGIIVGYKWGTSASSKTKDTTIERMANK